MGKFSIDFGYIVVSLFKSSDAVLVLTPQALAFRILLLFLPQNVLPRPFSFLARLDKLPVLDHNLGHALQSVTLQIDIVVLDQLAR